MSARSKTVRVIVAESNPMSSRLLSDALGKQPGIQVVAGISDPASLCESVVQFKPDVALLGAPGQNGTTESGRSLGLERMIGCPWVLLFDRSDPALVIAAFRAGAKGVFCRAQSDIAMLAKCVRRVAEGQIWIDNQQKSYLLEALTSGDGRRRRQSPRLTAREQSVIALVVEGLSNREIADQLKLSEHTIKNYLFQIFDKLGVSNRVELALYAVAKLNLTDAAAVNSPG